ncbi:MAG TPA: signal peptidase I [Syntrophorhabdaceae bacterium]|nr:signal peptidase I [Syntrophorhabdaceae bacterium]
MTRQKSKVREYTESLLIAVIIALFVRSVFIQAYKIPSGSMEPTLLVGDHLLVNRLSYVVKVPYFDNVIATLGKPKRGDVIVFRYPENTKVDFIKRVIATEGQTIEVKDKVIYINGTKTPDQWGHYNNNRPEPRNPYIKDMFGPHSKDNFGPYVVPKDAVFAMGDNRDNSADSRFWGPVLKEHLVGRALIIYFSLNSGTSDPFEFVRWSRLGKLIR